MMATAMNQAFLEEDCIERILFRVIKLNPKKAFYLEILPILSEEVGLQFATKFIKNYFEEVELSDTYITNRALHRKVVCEIGSVGTWSRYVEQTLVPSNVNCLLRQFMQSHYNNVFFWEENPPLLFLHEYNCWCIAAGRTDLLFDLCNNRNVDHREYIDALDVRMDIMRQRGFVGNSLSLPEFMHVHLYASLFPFDTLVEAESDGD